MLVRPSRREADGVSFVEFVIFLFLIVPPGFDARSVSAPRTHQRGGQDQENRQQEQNPSAQPNERW